ncbi:MAG: limonene-1,2-epoxide hydrolase family protein [Pseudomonadota bacterium]
MTNLDRALSFFKSWETCDLDAVIEAASPGIFYHNIPMDPITGRDGLRKFAEPFLQGATHCVWEIHHIAENASGAVLSERSDNFHMRTGNIISVRVMGTLEFDQSGLITHWRDYFDLAEFQSQMT